MPEQKATPRVFFEAWRGRYADNPRAIFEHLLNDESDSWTFQWATTPGAARPTGLDPRARTIPRNRAAYFNALMSASHLVTNDMMPRMPPRIKPLEYVQTWHGTPLKRIGFETESKAVSKRYLQRLERDVRRWSYLLSPGPEITLVLRRAFGYEGDVIESGYPRNDVLLSATADLTRQRVRDSLNIGESTRVVLYAPTWRDNRVGPDGRPAWVPQFDLSTVGRQLDDTVILQRLHPVVQAGAPPSSGPIIDVSGWPDIADLYLAADVLVTDYSSAMFDFAVTDRPIVLYPFDLGSYERDCRQTYWPLQEIAPGPLVTTAADLSEVLSDAGLSRLPSSTSYRVFRERFLPNDDGRASERVIRTVFHV
ncbi:MAG: CDP-glycerol glycerophosphotransferase family protein [Actinobacteria bacterium]|nr:CDP-glycerol glycerophosphotransferase family protein [Actinomycetota bacterium]